MVVGGRAAACRRLLSHPSRGARAAARAGRGGVDPNDPATWRAGGDAPLEVEADEPVYQLSPDELASLLGGGVAAADGAPFALGDYADEEPEPDSASEALEAGSKLAGAGDFAGALAYYELAFTLPGAGPLRVRGKPKDLSGMEKPTAHYNAACCHSQLGAEELALQQLFLAVENGFDDYETLLQDPDLAPVRQSPQFQSLAARLKPSPGLFGALFGGR